MSLSRAAAVLVLWGAALLAPGASVLAGSEGEISQQTSAGSLGELLDRAHALFLEGEHADSVRVFDQAISQRPDIEPHLWQRGISLYYLERWSACLEQFVRHRTVNPADVENAIWHFLCAARRDGLEDARAGLLPVGRDGRVPLPALYELFAGRGTVEQVERAMAQSGRGSARDRQFYGHLYLGLWFEVLGNQHRAERHLRRAVELGFPHAMGSVADYHLRRLRKEVRALDG